MEIINLTPHELKIQKEDGSVRLIPPSGSVVRCVLTTEDRGTLDGIKITAKRFGDVIGLPEPKDKTIYVTSEISASTIWELFPERRQDVFIPGTLIRDKDTGTPLYCEGLNSSWER